MRMPICCPTVNPHENLNKRALGDFQYELWQGSEDINLTFDAAEGSPPKRRKSERDDHFTLVHRPKDPQGVPTFSSSDDEFSSDGESVSDEFGFTVVLRQKTDVDSTVKHESGASCPSSPELVVASPPIIKTEPGTERRDSSFDWDEEDWSLL